MTSIKLQRLLALAIGILLVTSGCNSSSTGAAPAKNGVEAPTTAAAAGAAEKETAMLDYPETRRVDQVDDYHGTKVPDPYRWLEDDVRESKEVADWVAAENKVARAYLDAIPAHRPWAEPGAAAVTFLPKMTEHPEPVGVNWITRKSSPAAKSASSRHPSLA